MSLFCISLKRSANSGTPQQAQTQQIEFLPVMQCCLVGQIVVYPMMQVIQYQHVGPWILQQFHLIINLQEQKKKVII